MELGFKLGRQALSDVRVTTQREETNVVTERMTTTKMEGRTHIPRLDAEKCVTCALCQCLCPDLAVTRDEGKEKSIEIDYSICRGCGVCAFVCPKGAIKMVLEG
jgi:2-oxoacid:acceptor oxidoreductase delta subunit (pyruvate/2-ketoisovalerate family)